MYRYTPLFYVFISKCTEFCCHIKMLFLNSQTYRQKILVLGNRWRFNTSICNNAQFMSKYGSKIAQFLLFIRFSH